jgi:hypothetical protein
MNILLLSGLWSQSLSSARAFLIIIVSATTTLKLGDQVAELFGTKYHL